MPKATALGDIEQAVAAFVASALGCEAVRGERVAAFATNAVFEVDADERQFVVKASTIDDALHAEVWACARAIQAGCAAPAILVRGRLGADNEMSAFIMSRAAGSPIPARHPALVEIGVCLRRLHEVRLPGFGWLAQASRDEGGRFSLPHGSWLGFLNGILADARGLAESHALAAEVAAAAAAAIDTHADALATLGIGSLCHGDLKTAHILVDKGGIATLIDWGDAVVGDPLWDIARFAHRAEPASISLLLDGYGTDRALANELAWRVPLYGALWMLVDAIVDWRLGLPAEAPLEAAMGYLENGA